MYRRAICALAFCLALTTISAQETESTEAEYVPQWIGSIYMDIGGPLRQFDRNINDTGLGVGGELLYNVQYEQPVWAGIGVHSFAFDDYSLIYSQIFDGEFFEYKDITASRLFIAHAIFRFQPEINFFVQPYFQGGFGMHWFFTNTKIEDTAIDEVVDRISENQDSAFGYSLHVGLQVDLKRSGDLRADVRVGYFKNPSVEYMRYDADLGGVDGFPIDYFETRESVVDILGVHGGLTFLF